MAFAVSTIIAGIGVAITGVGLYEKYEADKKTSSAQHAAAMDQMQIAQLQAGNVDVQQQQLALQSKQTLLQNETQRGVIGDQAQADAIRIQAAELDATRQRRAAIRAGIVARAQNLTAATNAGATQSGSTALSQSEASVSGQVNTNVTGINQQLDVGEQLYQINKSISQKYLNASYANDEFVKSSEALQSKTLDTQREIYKLGGEASLHYSDAAISQGNSSFWGGLSTIGISLAGNSKEIGKFFKFGDK